MRPILNFPSILALSRHLGLPQATVYSRLWALEERGQPVTLESLAARRPRIAHASAHAIPVTLADGREMPSIKHAAAAVGVMWKTAKKWVTEGKPIAPRKKDSLALTVRERAEVPYSTVVSRLRRGVPLEVALLRKVRAPKPAKPRKEKPAPVKSEPKRISLAEWTPGQRRARKIMSAWAAYYQPSEAA
jgi:hypothetical protein